MLARMHRPVHPFNTPLASLALGDSGHRADDPHIRSRRQRPWPRQTRTQPVAPLADRGRGRARPMGARGAPVAAGQNVDQAFPQRLPHSDCQHRWRVSPVDLVHHQQIARIDVQVLRAFEDG